MVANIKSDLYLYFLLGQILNPKFLSAMSVSTCHCTPAYPLQGLGELESISAAFTHVLIFTKWSCIWERKCLNHLDQTLTRPSPASSLLQCPCDVKLSRGVNRQVGGCVDNLSFLSYPGAIPHLNWAEYFHWVGTRLTLIPFSWKKRVKPRQVISLSRVSTGRWVPAHDCCRRRLHPPRSLLSCLSPLSSSLQLCLAPEKFHSENHTRHVLHKHFTVPLYLMS